MSDKYDKIYVYTDGSCNTVTKDMGIGIYAHFNLNGNAVEYSKYIGLGTNNIAELTAIKVALRKLRKYKGVSTVIYTDSRYCLGVLTKGYRVNANKSLVAEIKAELEKRPNTYLAFVKGHGKDGEYCLGNDKADKLAVAARKSLQS